MKLAKTRGSTYLQIELFDLFVSSDIWQADPVSRVSGPDPDEKPDPDRKSGKIY